MGFLNQAIQAPRQHKRNAYILASVVTAIVPAATAGMFIWLMPEGCALRDVDASVYRWTCLFPGLMVAVPPVIAMLMPVFVFLNNRMKRKAPDGWLVTPLFAGFFTQVVLIGAYLIALDPAYRTRLFGEIAFIPQPFVAGATAGVVFWLTLHWANATPSGLDRVGQ